ncbi:MAG TPA: HAMP domain-containing sensor histidine kinase [Gemmatimonadaceae bacterium]
MTAPSRSDSQSEPGTSTEPMQGLAERLSPDLEAARNRISGRFGLVPSFFMMARDEPPIVDAMFGMVEFTYFDSPLPTLFKERLFTYVSRFCAVPYCMARHCAFLVGCGNVAGHPDVEGISVDEAVALLERPFPDAERRDEILAQLRAVEGELDQWPNPTSALADTILCAAAVVFVLPQEHEPLLAELERVLGSRRHNYLMLFLGFIRFAHFWTESHPQLRIEDDVEHLLGEQRALAKWVATYANRTEMEVTQAKAEILELERLRARTEKSERDVADLREEVATQMRAAQAAEAERRATASFMATVSHELRTPLNAVIGYTELLQSGLGGSLGDTALSYIARIKATAHHQQQIIEEILSFSRLDAGRESVRVEAVSLAELHDEVCAVIVPLAESRGLTFTANFIDAPAALTTDPGKLRQVLLNLLGNAVKFTRAGSVTLTVAGASDSIAFTVTDTGPGILAADRERIFEPFVQLDAGSTREVGGTGLGLAITKRLVGLLDGDISVDAKEGGGSTFVVSLPREKRSPAHA